MGHDIKNMKPISMNKAANKLVTSETPCTAELLDLMDCVKRHPGAEADSKCARQRAALALCSGKKARATASGQRGLLMRNLQLLVSSWKRYGY